MSNIKRVYVRKKSGFDIEANDLKKELVSVAGVETVKNVEIFNTYTVENMDDALFNKAVDTVFSEKPVDDVFLSLPNEQGKFVFGVEYLPGQYDQRADSASQCIQLISQGERAKVASMKIYAIEGDLTNSQKETIKSYVINPVEAREAALMLPQTLSMHYPSASKVRAIEGFNSFDDKKLEAFRVENGLAMDFDDIQFARDYFVSRGTNPTMTEIKVIDTYWSDHCRHTTFLTCLDQVAFEDAEAEKMYAEYLAMRKILKREHKPVTLMDVATIGAKYLKHKGVLKNMDESDEINACSVKIKVNVNGENEDWLLLFKNETHNHPTEIEPFGGAATCIGGAIRDPLANRGYVYQAMRITGVGDATAKMSETIPGKLPQRKIARTSAAGYSSYGNQIGLATGIVDEIFDSGYTAKHMELGAVVGAVKEEYVRREEPAPGDIVILLGGRTGRDGCGGATGSSKAHNLKSLDSCGAEVQKGNAPEERKLQRLFRNPKVTSLIKRCNDFGAGGVSVAIGELADGLKIDLDKVKKKYEGLSPTEQAISESQERMAVVVERQKAEEFVSLAKEENLEATIVASVTEEPNMVMLSGGDVVVNLSREFLSSNGASKHKDALVIKAQALSSQIPDDFETGMKQLLSDLNVASKQALSERFDSTIGHGTVTMPFGGKRQKTPIQAMSALIPVLSGETSTASVMSWGYNPIVAKASPFLGGYLAVVESISKLIASGSARKDVYLTFQEYFERMTDNISWGKPLGALLGALKAQVELGAASIGGKDSMSGSFEDIHVPPTLISFGVSTADAKDIITPELKAAGSYLYMLCPDYDGITPKSESLKRTFEEMKTLIKEGKVLSCASLGYGGMAEWLFKMAIGNNLGVAIEESVTIEELFSLKYGSFIFETKEELPSLRLVAKTLEGPIITYKNAKLPLSELEEVYEGKLEKVYHLKVEQQDEKIPNTFIDTNKEYTLNYHCAKPKVIIPSFPGTNCEYDTAYAFEKAGADPKIFMVRNIEEEMVSQSVQGFLKELEDSQMVFLPGGFSAGDEPEGSAKFITSFFRNPFIKDAVNKRLEKEDFLMGGICNGFQALVKLGLLPNGKITEPSKEDVTLTFNTIGRHQSKIVYTKLVSNASPWLALAKVGDVYSVPISHGEGRFVASMEMMKSLEVNNLIMTRYCDESGVSSMNISVNPNGSMGAVEGIISFNGQIIGKMGHSERIGQNLYKNVSGDYDMKLFESGVQYFK